METECPACRGDGRDRYSDYLMECADCGGTGEYFTHADDCEDDLCALNGDEHSCGGQVVTCGCASSTTSEA